MTSSADPHPSRDELTALSDGRLAGPDATAVESHVATCDACAAALGELGARNELVLRLRSAVDGDKTSPCVSLTEGIDEIRKFLEPSTYPGSQGRLGHYEILECLGQGAFGIVFRAFDDSLQRVVALKVLSPAMAATSPPRKRFLREARVAAQLRHEHVVRIYAVEELPTPYLVMEYIPGETLQERLDRVGPLEASVVLRLGRQMAQGLAAAHEQGLIHRDIKPGNILLESGVEERVKITDFGLARAADDAQLTQSGLVAGTPMYMAPEQARGETIDQRADLFSLGSVLYAMVSGRPPFRASNTVAVLKRVCDDTPRPIPELIPETPQWLCDIIARLQAKNPHERFQSASEVAGLLDECLSHGPNVPSGIVAVPAVPTVPHPNPRTGQPNWRARWSIAAAVLLCLLAGLGVTEATGVTQLARTVVNIVTNEGTLVIEIDDPTVQVSLDGEELTISGGGVQEVRLRPGQYQFTATRDGRPVKQELVTITRGGERVVTVSHEAVERVIAAPAAAAEPDAFVRLAGEGVAERRFDTLAAAVQTANDGDTIEIRGNGPFVCGPTRITVRLTIRAGEGFHPILRFHSEDSRVSAVLLETESALVLEGLALHFIVQDLKPEDPSSFFLNTPKDLRIANCRFLMRPTGHCIHTCSAELRNCEFLVPKTYGAGVVNIFLRESARRLVIDNCLLSDSVRVTHERADAQGALVQLTRNTILTNYWGGVWLQEQFEKAPHPENLDQRPRHLSIRASENIFDTSSAFQFEQYPEMLLPSRAAEAYVAHVVDWTGERNLYAGEDLLFRLNTSGEGFVEPANPVKNLEDWRRFWGTGEPNSLEGRVRYEGGNLRARLEASPDQLTPQDFRLRPDSAGYRALPDGKDLGADVDLVGPGAAYERWKKTPEYQQWLKVSEQDNGQ